MITIVYTVGKIRYGTKDTVNWTPSMTHMNSDGFWVQVRTLVKESTVFTYV